MSRVPTAGKAGRASCKARNGVQLRNWVFSDAKKYNTVVYDIHKMLQKTSETGAGAVGKNAPRERARWSLAQTTTSSGALLASRRIRM